jgi:hypothetical protein
MIRHNQLLPLCISQSAWQIEKKRDKRFHVRIKRDPQLSVDYSKLSQNWDFRSRSPAEYRRDKNARPRLNPPRLLTGSSTAILKYVEDLS